MAIFHLSAGIHSRAKGHSAIAGAAYRARTTMTDERTGERHDFSRRAADVLFQGVYAPADAPDWTRDRSQLWNHVEAFEKRRDAQLAKVFDIALPHELSLEQNRRLLQDWIRENFTRKGLVADAVIHGPDRASDPRNIHAHVAVMLRKLDGTEFSAKKERTASNDERKAELEAQRASWEKLANRHLERAGLDVRIDRRTLKEQGIEAEPTKHLGPTATALERDGIASELGNANREIAQRNADRRELAALEAEERQIGAQIIDLAVERSKRETSAFAKAAADRRAGAAATGKSGREGEARDQPEEGISTYPAPSENAPAATGARTNVAPEPETARRHQPSVIEARIIECAEQAQSGGAEIERNREGRRASRAEALADRFRPEGARENEAATVFGPEAFAARLEQAGIVVARCTAADVQALDALRRDEDFARLAAETNGEAFRPHHLAQLVEGDLAAVTRAGNVYRVRPDQLGDAALELPADLPSVTAARVSVETDRAQIAQLWAERRADIATERESDAADREMRAAVRTVEREVSQTIATAEHAVDRGFSAAGKAVRSVVGSVIGFFAGWFDAPVRLTPDEVHRREQVAPEQAEARAVDEAAQQNEAARDWQISEQSRQQQAEELSLSARFGTPRSRDRARDDDRDQGYERER